jgi:lipoate-protein ligase A
MDVLVEDPPCLDPAANLALEEALARATPPGPLLRLWQSTRCVVVGRGQRIAREVDLVTCQRDGVPVLRRASGGGTVFLDLGTVNLSLAVPGRQPDLIDDLANLVSDAIGRLGLVATARRRGVYVNATKVSGIACQATLTGTVAHATVLVTTAPELASAYLTPEPPNPYPLDSERAVVAALATLDPVLACGTRLPTCRARRRRNSLRPAATPTATRRRTCLAGEALCDAIQPTAVASDRLWPVVCRPWPRRWPGHDAAVTVRPGELRYGRG